MRSTKFRILPHIEYNSRAMTSFPEYVAVIRNALRWRGAPTEYGPPETNYNRFIRWSRVGVLSKIFSGLAAKAGKPDALMINATLLKAHRTGARFIKKDLFPDIEVEPRVT